MNNTNNKVAYNKGDIYHVRSGAINSVGDEIWSDRPAVIISNDTSNKYSGVVTIVYLTTSKKKRMRPTHVPILSGTTQALAMCEQIFSVDKTRLDDYIGKITDEEIANIDSALMFQLEINPAARPTSIFKKWENYINRNNMNIDKYNVPDFDQPLDAEIALPYNTLVHPDDYTKILEGEIETLKDEVEKYKQLYDTCKGYLVS
jgi:mRNA-degrading endonuclease toxin of MazEF toxin-antitoxin module